MKRLIKTIYLENGELYCVISGRRIKLAMCEPKVEIYEDAVNISTIGKGYKVKKKRISLVLCEDMNLTRDVDENYLRKIVSFELAADCQREDGVFERIKFDNIVPIEIELDGKWSFEISPYSSEGNRLLNI